MSDSKNLKTKVKAWKDTFNPAGGKRKRVSAPQSDLVTRKLDNDLAAAEEEGKQEATSGEGDTPNGIEEAQKYAGTPEHFAHDWTSSDLTLAPEHKWFGEDASYSSHRSYPASCSDPSRREMYNSCLTSDLKD